MTQPAPAYPIDRYLNIRTAYAPSFFADGQRLAFLTDITGLPQVWQVGLPSDPDSLMWPDQLTFGSDRVMTVRCSPASGDDRVLFARDAGGNENAQLYLLDTDSGVETCLTSGHESAMHIPGEWSDDGQQLLFAANRRNPAIFDVYLQSLAGDLRIVWENNQPGFPFEMVFSPDGKRVTVAFMIGSFDNRLCEIDLESGEVRLISPDVAGVRYDNLSYDPDGQTLLVITDYKSDFMYIARLNLASRMIEKLITPDWDVETIKRSPDGRSLAYTVNVDGATNFFIYDLNRGDTRQISGLSETPGVSDLLTFSPDSSQLAFMFHAATRTMDIFTWTLETDSVQAVTRSSHAGLPVESFVPPELVHYPTFDKDEQGATRQIPAWFYRPARSGNAPLPTIIIVHGGPEGQSRPNFSLVIQYFLHSGYAVFVPNVRGSTGYGKTYSHLDDVEKRMDSVADLAHGAHWLKAQPEIDGDRLVVYGGSYGGFMVLSAVTTYPDLWAAGVDIVGISSFVTFLENTSEYRRVAREVEYGSLEHDREFLDSISPINHLDQVKAPLIVIHGANDPRVPLSETEQLVAALQERAVPVEFLVFDDEGHGIIKLKNKRVAYPAIVDFLDKHVGNGESLG